jgi:hypothetical protein
MQNPLRDIEFKWITHAAVLIRTPLASLITDPWFGFPFHHDTFHCYPPFSENIEDLVKSIDAIHISHIHQDHLCKKSLHYFNRNIPIFITQYKNKKMLETLKSMGFSTIHEIPTQLSGFFTFQDLKIYTLEAENNEHSFDSALIVSHESKNFLFKNDCSLNQNSIRLLKEKFAKFQGLFVGYTSINPFPTCFDFTYIQKNIPHKEINKIIAAKFHKNLDQLHNLIHELHPKWVFPYANNLRFFNENNFIHNRIAENFKIPHSIAPDSNILAHEHPPLSINSNGQLTFKSSSAPPSLISCQITSPKNKKLTLDIPAIKNKCRNVINASRVGWEHPMTIQFQIINDADSEKLTFTVDSQSLDIKDTTEYDSNVDLILEYNFSIFKKFIENELTWKQLHFTYQFKATIINPFPRQSSPLRWLA